MTLLSKEELDIVEANNFLFDKTSFIDFKHHYEIRLKDAAWSPRWFTYTTILTLWLEKNVAPFKEGRWMIENFSTNNTTTVHFKEGKDATTFKMFWI